MMDWNRQKQRGSEDFRKLSVEVIFLILCARTVPASPPASPGLHLGLRCFLGWSPMRRVAELCRGAALLAQRRVRALGLGGGWVEGLGVLPLGLLLLLLLFVAGQAEEEAEDGFQIAIPNLCGSAKIKSS